ncbi:MULTISPECIES: LysR family transcriptional regulator ArgP [Vibrio]|jgi:LysR family transcriptional regulator (chromosome initiation inhibitor)|uniref:HTH-type transcriptional regulator ArgP n=1 Tax=Vibrio brasiliensis LMG 20546 TaxID=945543 RepID=E8LVH8_9VIBR|nr:MULTISPECIES: LysR family transcriptional regulator ArgP [Vibrio]EGA65265.1 chromosome replication initiation inhibitor protein [Vibrio brasiliensis LMG 20546]MCG9650360.1 LysR family transcriptional regulator ArgP [Vibrio brasiliensis]TMX46400.1 transcriptional regulator ArgP [Vibrio sp. Hep-1b-8]
MRGLDYKWIEALEAVVNQGSFERAAQQLCISQSAVSQRVKQLEKFLAKSVLIREQPPRLTTAGKKLMGLYHRVQLLESEVLPELTNQESLRPVQIFIATNADSLATWLLPALTPIMTTRHVEFDLAVHGEDRTLDKLKKGEVTGAISWESEPISGCYAEYLGRMDYVCVANPEFAQRYFANGVTREALKRAPAVAFDQYDEMHQMFLKQHFNLSPEVITHHRVASSEAFVKLALLGSAYCLIPRLQISQELEQGTLVDLMPGFLLSFKIYWHHWQLETGLLKEITQAIVEYSRQELPK